MSRDRQVKAVRLAFCATPMKQKFNLVYVVAAIAIGSAVIAINVLMWKQTQVDAISPAGRALSEKDPARFKRELKEHRDVEAKEAKKP